MQLVHFFTILTFGGLMGNSTLAEQLCLPPVDVAGDSQLQNVSLVE